MVLQRAPANAVIWGTATAGAQVTTIVSGWAAQGGTETLVTTAGADGKWRQALRATPASLQEESTLTVSTDREDDLPVVLGNILFGDVYLCSGQSNMAYTVSGGSIWGGIVGSNTWLTELTADGNAIRGITVGTGTDCSSVSCEAPFDELASVAHPWQELDSDAVGTMAAACYYFARELQEYVPEVPLGLVSASWGGTDIRQWRPTENASYGIGDLYNSMIAPFTVGPMTLAGFTWYQGEANSGEPTFYATAQSEMIVEWRDAFAVPDAWFGFVQLADWLGDWAAIRQAQLQALSLPHVGMSSAVDLGHYVNLHPVDKWTIGQRLARQALAQAHDGADLQHAFFPLYGGARVVDRRGDTLSIQISLTTNGALSEAELSSGQRAAAPSREPLTRVMPETDHKTFGKRVANKCGPIAHHKCGWPAIYGTTAAGGECALILPDVPSEAAVGAMVSADQRSLLFIARGVPEGFTPTATSYGYAAHPRTVFFTRQSPDGFGGLPVLPWYAPISTSNLFRAPWPSVDELPPPCEAA